MKGAIATETKHQRITGIKKCIHRREISSKNRSWGICAPFESLYLRKINL